MTEADDDDVHDDDLDDDDDGETGAAPDLAALGLGDLGAALGGGLPDLGSMMDGLAKVQEIQEATFEGSAGGGTVKVVANGRMEVTSVTIHPDALDPPDAELVADLVLAALRDLTARIAAAQQSAMGPLGGIFGSP